VRRAGAWLSQAYDVEEGTHIALAGWVLVVLLGFRIRAGELEL